MSDTYGVLPLDEVQVATSGEACGDPALTVVADYLMAVINARATTAWRSIEPPSSPVKDGKDFPVNGAFPHDPATSHFSSKSLPALYLWRSQGGQVEDHGHDIRIATGTWTLWWIYRETTDAKRALRFPFANAIAKIIDDALDRERDPAYVQAGDTDPLAPTYAAASDSIKTSSATATSPQSFTGVALNGAIGGAEMNPPRSPTVTLAGPADAFIAGAEYSWTGINAIGQEATITVATDGPGTYDAQYDLVQVTAIDAPAQASAGGTQRFGTAAKAGLGTDVYDAAGIWSIRASKPTPKIINIQIQNGDPRPFDALEVLLEVQERRLVDITQFALLDDGDGSGGTNAGAEMTFLREDDSVFSTAFYD